MTDDGAFRVIVTRTTTLVREICEAQGITSSTAQTMGDLLTGTILFRETMSPGLRVQGIVRSAEPKISLIADSAPGGATRGLVQGQAISDFIAAEGTFLQMMRTLQNGSINQGIVKIAIEQTSQIDHNGISRGMMAYMKESEQVDTMLALCTRRDEQGGIVESGGYMVQLLPEVGRAPLSIMAERLEDFRTIDHLLVDGFDPQLVLDELLYGMPYTQLDQSDLAFSCWCSESRLLGALATLDKSEIRSMIDEEAPLEIDCEYCRKHYVIQTHRLAGLISSN